MENDNIKKERFFAGGFLYNPATKSVLMHKRDGNTKIHPHKWAFFGGTSEDNETPKETFVRELREEIGVDLSGEKVKPLCDYFNKEFKTHRYVFFVESGMDKSEMTLGEGEDFDWVPLDKVLDYDITEKTERDLKTFLKLIREKI